MKRKRRKEVELYVPKGYTFEELYDGDDTGYGFEEESLALQEEVKIRYERNDGKTTESQKLRERGKSLVQEADDYKKCGNHNRINSQSCGEERL